MLAPLITEVATELEGQADVFAVDIDDFPDVAAKFGVSSVPTLFVIDADTVTRLAAPHTRKGLIAALGAG